MSGRIDMDELNIVQFANEAAIKVQQLGLTPSSTSTGGGVNIDNSGNAGAGVVVFSSHAAPVGRLIVGRASSATFGQTVAYFENAGTGHAIHGNNTAASPNATGSACNLTSTNSGASCLQVSGVETGRGSIKVTHTGTGTDANASGLSIDLQGAGTASKGIFIDSVANGTTGDLIDVRNNGNRIFAVRSDATFAIPQVQLGNSGAIWTQGNGSPEGVVTAPRGSMYSRLDGGASTCLYVKEAGTGNTGWVAK